MEYVVYVLSRTILILIDILQLAMLVRAILSWIDPMHEWRISAFLYSLTEPVILPVRALCEKKHWFEGLPLDMPFMITWLLLSVIGTVLMFI